MATFDSNEYDDQPEEETSSEPLPHPGLLQYMTPEQQQQMTHYDPEPNPVPDIVDRARQAVAFDPLEPAPPLWQARTMADLLNHPAVRMGMQVGMPAPYKPGGGLPAQMLPSNPLRQPDNMATIKKMFDEGKTYNDVAAHFGVTKGAVAGVLSREGQPSGITTGRRRVVTDPKDIADVLQRLKAGESYRQIGAAHGVGRTAIEGVDKRAAGQAGSAYKERPISMPPLNLPVEEPLDPADIAEFMKIFGHK